MSATLLAFFGLIHFYVGKPRNGKSLRVMMKIIEVLTKTEQQVVTNMVLRLDELQEYLDHKGYNIHVLERVTLLDDEQTRNFWLYRGEYVLPTPADYGSKGVKDPENVSYRPLFDDPRWRVGGKLFNSDGSPANFKGTCYVIDEVQNLWPARGWQGTGHHIAFYLSQHGKLGDTVYFITQNVKNVDRLLYSVAQDFTYCRNHRMEKHGRFRGDNKFSAKTYPGPVTDGNEVTLNVEDFQLDLQIACCYDTSAGVGMPGGGTADAGFRAKGIPLKTVWLGLAALLLVCFGAIKYVVPQMTRKIVAPAIDPRLTAGGPAVPGGPVVGPAAVPAVATRPPKPVPELVSLWSELAEGRLVVHALRSDGLELDPARVERYEPDGRPRPWVMVDGQIFALRPRSVARAEAAPEAGAKQAEGAPPGRPLLTPSPLSQLPGFGGAPKKP